MPAPARRSLLLLGLGGALDLGIPSMARANPRVAARAESPLAGVDPLFVDTGLTDRWQAAMKQDLGWSARWSPLDTADVLQQLEEGRIDAGLFLSHPRADELDKQGLIFERHTVASTDVLLLGPAQDLAGIRGETDPARALGQVLAAASAGAARWQPSPPASALAALADRLSNGQAGRAMPVAAASKASSVKSVATAPAYRLMTRAQWLKNPPRGEKLKPWLADVPAMQLQAQIACSFRSRHAGAKLLVSWLQWPLAQGAVKASRPGWRPVKE